MLSHSQKTVLLAPRRVLGFTRKALTTLHSAGWDALRQRLLARLAREHATSEYRRWVEAYDSLTDLDRSAIRRHIHRLTNKPLISVVMPTYNTPENWLRLAIESVRNQLYPHWELCIADDASPRPHVRRILEEYGAKDRRIKAVFRAKNGHISAASNSAIQLVTGTFIALLDHDDELPKHALYMVALELNNCPDADLIYSDEDKIDQKSRRYDPYFKPEWNPDLFLSQNYVSHLGVYRTSIVREAGGFQTGYEGAQDWDLALRIIERIPSSHVRHIPRVLYHWRAIPGSNALAVDEKHYVNEAQARVLASHFDRLGLDVEILPAVGGHWRIKYPLPQPPPLVTLIISTLNRFDLLHRCVESIYRKTAYPNFELITVDNRSDDPRIAEF